MSDLDRPAPPPGPTRGEWYGATIIAASLLVHAGVVASFVWTHDAEAARPPVETPIEVVQLPPEPKREPKPEPKPQTKAAPASKSAAAPDKPAPKQAEAKKSEPKKSEAKQAEAKKTEPRKAEAKTAARHEKAPTPAPKPDQTRQAQQAPRQPEPRQSVAERMRQLIGAPMDATALPAMAAGAGSALDDAMPYQQLVLSLVAKQKREGRHQGIPGHAVVAFVIGDAGEVLSCELREKSGDPTLDAEAEAMVHRAAPFPPPPPGGMRKFAFGLRFQAM